MAPLATTLRDFIFQALPPAFSKPLGTIYAVFCSIQNEGGELSAKLRFSLQK